ncbi:TetR/AcrR family transcriptional regulator [Aquicoccus sp. G2-2]|uniref:TetR/AcrR family transcriptional regulator n=1 Tax=Aquicoccus sp. G2-2 TaxID=3092120 RepID=UPI002ADF6251|nr:TetR/AcrR family transcriptional regulator [Aquicoccus sp. G2-2]MEA1112607.1 TetR/AcrR family transcriptional regulator [Aquicoccus sp. G2-2]
MARTIAKDHGEKRAQILKSAAKVFANKGFDRASMSLLAAECGISKANIYHYYESKDALLFDVLDNYLSTLRDRVCGIDLTGKPPEAALRETVLQILLAYQGADDEHRVQGSGLAALPQAQQSVLRAYQRDMVRHLSSILAANAPAQFENAPDKLRATTMSVFGMLNWFYMWNPGADAPARHAYARHISDLTLGGLGAL